MDLKHTNSQNSLARSLARSLFSKALYTVLLVTTRSIKSIIPNETKRKKLAEQITIKKAKRTDEDDDDPHEM